MSELIQDIVKVEEVPASSENKGSRDFDYALARKRSSVAKWKGLEYLDKYLVDFEAIFSRAGGKIYWAQDSLEAVHEVAGILAKNKKNQASLADYLHAGEINLVENLQQQGFKISDKSNSNITICSAAFIAADNGLVVIPAFEYKMFKNISGASILIILAGIDSIVQSVFDAEQLLMVLSKSITGDINLPFTYYTNGVTGREMPEIHLVLLDNGRTKILADKANREILYCIHCNACSNVCPVVKNSKLHPVINNFKGPVGALALPYLTEENTSKAFTSTTCGKCTEVCPVNINLHNLFLFQRKTMVVNNQICKTEKWIYYFWKKTMLNREMMNRGGAKTKNFLLQNFFRKSWGEERILPKLATKSFNESWRELMRF